MFNKLIKKLKNKPKVIFRSIHDMKEELSKEEKKQAFFDKYRKECERANQRTVKKNPYNKRSPLEYNQRRGRNKNLTKS